MYLPYVGSIEWACVDESEGNSPRDCSFSCPIVERTIAYSHIERWAKTELHTAFTEGRL